MIVQEEHYSPRRLLRVLSMAAGIVVLSFLFSIRYQFMIDKILALVFLQGLFFPVFIAFLTSERLKGRLHYNQANDYRVISRMFLLMLLCYYGFSYLPAYCLPVMIPAVFITVVSNPTIGLVTSIYLNVLLCLVSECSYYELASYIILSILGCLLAEFFAIKKYRIYTNILMFALSLSIPGIFYYFSCIELNYYIFLYGAIGGACCNLLVMLFFNRLHGRAETAVQRLLTKIIEPAYPLVQEIKNFSQIDYLHAVNVSKLAHECARQIGADPDVAAAAGFYYRLGKLEGEPFVENGVALAENHCFPVRVTAILAEYNGQIRLPSTVESAIVHMVDAVVTKFELLDKDTLSSTWNHDIVIYQTMNEKSSSGIYDESGLSMNQYLKIRDYLVKGGVFK